MKYTWIEKSIDNKTGEPIWILHRGYKWFGKLFAWSFENDEKTTNVAIMEKWKAFYNAEVYTHTPWINKE